MSNLIGWRLEMGVVSEFIQQGKDLPMGKYLFLLKVKGYTLLYLRYNMRKRTFYYVRRMKI